MGVTPEGVEIPRSLVDEEMQGKLRAMPKEFQPSIPMGPDPKWRYMWRVGPRPSNTHFQVSCSFFPFNLIRVLLTLYSKFHHLFAGTKFRACDT